MSEEFYKMLQAFIKSDISLMVVRFPGIKNEQGKHLESMGFIKESGNDYLITKDNAKKIFQI